MAQGDKQAGAGHLAAVAVEDGSGGQVGKAANRGRRSPGNSKAAPPPASRTGYRFMFLSTRPAKPG